MPRHSPKPIGAKPSRRQRARMITVSPSSRKRRVSPEASSTARFPPALISSRLPSPSSLGARNGAGAEQVTGPQIAAAAAVMGDELRHRPIEMAGIAGGKPLRRQPLGGERSRQQKNFELDVERPGRLVCAIEQVGKRLRVVRRTRGLRRSERRQRLRRDHPGRDRWCRSSCRGMARAADIPRPECRAPTSR